MMHYILADEILGQNLFLFHLPWIFVLHFDLLSLTFDCLFYFCSRLLTQTYMTKSIVYLSRTEVLVN